MWEIIGEGNIAQFSLQYLHNVTYSETTEDVVTYDLREISLLFALVAIH